jgi:hypothetical protein
MALVWLNEGRLLAGDQRMLWRAAAWLIGACAFVYIAWRFANSVGRPDDSLRLTESKSPKTEEISQRTGLVLLFALAALFLWNSHDGPALVKIPVVLGWLCLLIFAQHLHIFLHELGHLLAAWALGYRLSKIQVGVGARVYTRTFPNGFRLEWRVWPAAGLMFAANRSTRNLRVRQSLFIAGGPLVDGVLFSVGYKLIFLGGFSRAFLEGPGGVVAWILFIWVTMIFLGNLIPRMVRLGGQKFLSDGCWLWMLCTTSRRRISGLLAQMQWQHAREFFGFDDVEHLFPFERRQAAPVKATISRETFQSQCSRLRCRLLPTR